MEHKLAENLEIQFKLKNQKLTQHAFMKLQNKLIRNEMELAPNEFQFINRQSSINSIDSASDENDNRNPV